ncbi:MAG TPA: hypothetical protein VK447_18190 [Myxococcaceae bacterium]|nr:hypothetical protein [Myxococcaceae bacterium]
MNDDQDLQSFKARIGFDRLVDSGSPDVGVAADWDGIREFLPSREAGWTQFSDDVDPPMAGIVMRQWVFRRGKANFSLRIYVSSVGPSAARDRFLAAATTTSMMTIPYVRGPSHLGQVSVQMPGEPLQSVLWVFHNVFVQLRDNSGISVEPIARALQGYMERHVTQNVSRYLPQFGKVNLSRNPVQVGQEVEVEVHPKDPAAMKRLRIGLSAPPTELDLTRQSTTASTYEALRPGKVEVEATLADQNFLLVSTTRVQVEIQPKR